ncbi:MAG: hypothetical protein PHW10_05405 [Candidatus Peribacteraceae bacterium]|nr:hypothetical protein [Candidatus Peribacteraceae bacterium]
MKALDQTSPVSSPSDSWELGQAAYAKGDQVRRRYDAKTKTLYWERMTKVSASPSDAGGVQPGTPASYEQYVRDDNLGTETIAQVRGKINAEWGPRIWARVQEQFARMDGGLQEQYRAKAIVQGVDPLLLFANRAGGLNDSEKAALRDWQAGGFLPSKDPDWGRGESLGAEPDRERQLRGQRLLARVALNRGRRAEGLPLINALPEETQLPYAQRQALRQEQAWRENLERQRAAAQQTPPSSAERPIAAPTPVPAAAPTSDPAPKTVQIINVAPRSPTPAVPPASEKTPPSFSWEKAVAAFAVVGAWFGNWFKKSEAARAGGGEKGVEKRAEKTVESNTKKEIERLAGSDGKRVTALLASIGAKSVTFTQDNEHAWAEFEFGGRKQFLEIKPFDERPFVLEYHPSGVKQNAPCPTLSVAVSLLRKMNAKPEKKPEAKKEMGELETKVTEFVGNKAEKMAAIVQDVFSGDSSYAFRFRFDSPLDGSMYGSIGSIPFHVDVAPDGNPVIIVNVIGDFGSAAHYHSLAEFRDGMVALKNRSQASKAERARREETATAVFNEKFGEDGQRLREELADIGAVDLTMKRFDGLPSMAGVFFAIKGNKFFLMVDTMDEDAMCTLHWREHDEAYFANQKTFEDILALLMKNHGAEKK